MGGVPVSPATEKQKSPIIKIVQTILADPDSLSIPQLEAEINHLVYDLYNLTPEERRIIKNAKNKQKQGIVRNCLNIRMKMKFLDKKG